MDLHILSMSTLDSLGQGRGKGGEHAEPWNVYMATVMWITRCWLPFMTETGRQSFARYPVARHVSCGRVLID